MRSRGFAAWRGTGPAMTWYWSASAAGATRTSHTWRRSWGTWCDSRHACDRRAPRIAVTELLNSLVKALRAFHMYLPNNPIHQRATENLRTAFAPVWEGLDELVLTVAETDFVWEDQVVYHQPNKSDSIAWELFKDGMRSLTVRRGAEAEELPRFLELINRARFLTSDAGDDLLTLLWEQEFQFIHYKFIEFFGEGTGSLPEQSGSYNTGGSDEHEAGQRHAQAAEEAPPRPKGVVDVEDFDSTLYFLDENEINTIAAEIQAEYRRDVRARRWPPSSISSSWSRGRISGRRSWGSWSSSSPIS